MTCVDQIPDPANNQALESLRELLHKGKHVRQKALD